MYIPAIGLVYSPIARYMFVRYHFVRELVKHKIIKVVHVATEYQTADLFTHPLCPKIFQKHLAALFNFVSIPVKSVACSAISSNLSSNLFSDEAPDFVVHACTLVS